MTTEPLPRRHPDYVAPTLAPAADFRRYAKRIGHRPPDPHARDIAAVIARKHCAGRTGRTGDKDVLDALQDPPNDACDTSRAIAWLLDTIRIEEVTKLTVRCGVTYEALARHVRVKAQQRDDLVMYLNQYSIPPDGETVHDAFFDRNSRREPS